MTATDSISLLDNWAVSGSNIEEFKDINRKLAEATHCDKEKVSEIPYFTSYARAYHEAAKKTGETGKVPFFVLSKETLEKVQMTGGKIQCGYVLDEKLPSEALKEESFNGNGLMVKFNGRFVPFSDLTFGGFLQKAGLDGAGVYGDSLIRNELMIDNIYQSQKNKAFQFVWRETEDPDTGKKDMKIFGVMSSAYSYIPQTTICDVYDRLAVGEDFNHPVAKQWSIDHSITRIYSEYPDEAEDGLIPGVELRTSDIGTSSFMVYATMRQEKSNRYVIIASVSRIHKGSNDTEELLKKVNEEIFPELRVYPTLFKELDTPIVPPLVTNEDKKEQVEKLKGIYNKVFKSMKSGLSKKRKKELKKALIAEINPDREYTWRDIAEQLISVPDRVIGLDDTTSVFQAFRKDMGRAPFLLKDIKDKVVPFTTKENDEEEVILA